MARKRRGVQPARKRTLPKKTKRQFEVMGGVATMAASALVISVFLLTSLDRVLIATNQYASVIASVLVDLANGDRVGQNVGALTMNPVLVEAAQAKANDMAAKSYFAHISPDGKDSWHWFKEAGYKFAYAGENLAVDFSDSADVERAWMNSPTHRKNLLDPHFTEIGIATAAGYYQGHPTVFVVQMFGTPLSQAQAQEVIVTSNSPSDASQPALASTQGDVSVLGTSGSGEATPPVELAAANEKPLPKTITTPSTRPQAEPIVGAPDSAPEQARPTFREVAQPGSGPTITVERLETPDYAPWWQHLVASPKQTLHYAYYAIGLFLIGALFAATGFEFHERHYKAFMAAGSAMVVMCVLFVAAESVVFKAPTVAKAGQMTASAASAF